MISVEEWRPVIGYEGYYEASSLGRVRSLDRYTPNVSAKKNNLVKGRVLKGRINRGGYLQFTLSVKGVTRTRPAHRLVGEAFLGPPPSGKSLILHGPNGQLDNSVTNLRWGDHSENTRDKRRDGTDHELNKTHCPQGHEYSGENLFFERDGSRKCRTCVNARGRAYWAKKYPPRPRKIVPRCNDCGRMVGSVEHVCPRAERRKNDLQR